MPIVAAHAAFPGVFAPFATGGGGGGSFSPADLFASGEAGAWWDMTDLSAMAANSDGTGALAVGDGVGYVQDKSGNGNHATQITAANKPILRQNASSQYYLEFDGSNAFLETPSIIVGTVGHFVVGAYQIRGPKNEPVYMAGDTTSNGQQRNFNHEISLRVNGGNEVYSVDTGTNMCVLSFVAPDTPSVTDNQAFLDGAELTPASSNSQTLDTLDTVGRIMASDSSNRSYGDVYEMVVMPEQRTVQDREDLEQYLADRFGVTLS